MSAIGGKADSTKVLSNAAPVAFSFDNGPRYQRARGRNFREKIIQDKNFQEKQFPKHGEYMWGERGEDRESRLGPKSVVAGAPNRGSRIRLLSAEKDAYPERFVLDANRCLRDFRSSGQFFQIVRVAMDEKPVAAPLDVGSARVAFVEVADDQRAQRSTSPNWLNRNRGW